MQNAQLIPVERKYLLLYLLSAVGGLTEDQVDVLGEKLMTEKQGSLLDIYQKARLPGSDNGVFKDRVLGSVRLDYPSDEQHRKPSLDALKPQDTPPGHVDWLATRHNNYPFWLDLYSLVGLELVIIDAKFKATKRGLRYADAICAIFPRLPRGKLLVVGRYTQELI